QTEQRRFPGAAAPDDDDKFSAFRREIHIVEDDRLAVGFTGLFEPYPILECCLAFHDGRCYVVYRGLPTVIRGNAFAYTGLAAGGAAPARERRAKDSGTSQCRTTRFEIRSTVSDRRWSMATRRSSDTRWSMPSRRFRLRSKGISRS